MSILRVIVEANNNIKVVKEAKENLELILEIIVSMSFNKKPFNLIESKFPEIARKIKSYSTIPECVSVLKDCKKTVESFMSNYPNDVCYRSINLRDVEWDNISNSKYVLLLLLIKYKNGNNIKANNTTLEHICPQTIIDGSEWDNKFPQSVRNEYIYNIGNCVLLDKKTNSSLSNKSFIEKKEKYVEFNLEDHIANQNLIVSRQSIWDRNIIDERKKNILDSLNKNFGFLI